MRKRQFSELRSLSISNHSFSSSKSLSQLSNANSFLIKNRQKPSQRSLHHGNTQLDCVNCVNHKLSDQQKIIKKNQKQQQIKDYREYINYLNSLKDINQENRQKMKAEAFRHNKFMIQEKSFLKSAKTQQDFEELLKILKKQQEENNQQSQFYETRKQLISTYNKALKAQLDQEKNKKNIMKTLQRSSSMDTKFKLLQNHQQYRKKVLMQKKLCNKEIQQQIVQNSIKKMEEKRQKIQQQRAFVQYAQKKFQNFTQFHQKTIQDPYYFARTYVNPQTYENVKNNQQKKKNNQKLQIQNKNQQRLQDLRKQSEANRTEVQKKMKAMKNYISILKNQVLQKQIIKQKQKQQSKRPLQKSKTDYHTQEISAEIRQIKPCTSCHKNYDSKYLSASINSTSI